MRRINNEKNYVSRKVWAIFAVAQVFGILADLHVLPRAFEPITGIAAFFLLFPGNLVSDMATHWLLGERWTGFQLLAVFIPIELLANLWVWLLALMVLRRLRREGSALSQPGTPD